MKKQLHMTVILPSSLMQAGKACCSTFLFLLLFTFVNKGLSQQYPYRFNYLTVDAGLSHTDANDLIQDKKGYIWVSTNFGLDRFDGYNIKRFYNSNTPLNNAFKNRLRSMAADDDGNIWLGTEGGLQRFDSKTEKYTDYSVGKNKSEPQFDKLIFHTDNCLYGLAGGELKIYRITGNTIHEQAPGKHAEISFSDMAFDRSGNLYLCGNNGAWMLDKNKVLKNISVAGCHEQNFTKICINNRQNLLLANGNQLYLASRTNVSLTKPGVLTNAPESFTVVKQYTGNTTISIKDIIEDKYADYWVNAQSGLLYLNSDLQMVQFINNKSSVSSLNSNALNRLYIDRSQCLWVCTFGGGVNYCDLNEKLFYTFQHNPEDPNSISGNYVRSVLDENGEDIWIGTNYNGLNHYNFMTKKFTFYNASQSAVKLKSDNITALLLDNDHNLWIGSDAGIEILKPNRKELWKPAGSKLFPVYAIETMAKDCYGNIWFGNHLDKYGVIWKDDQQNFHVKYYGESFFIFADKVKPELFISSTHGLKRVSIDRQGNILSTTVYEGGSAANSLSSSYSYPVSKQNDSTWWVGTIGGGLNRLIINSNNTYTIKRFDSTEIFKDVESLEIDNAGNIWMGGNGLQSLNPVTGKLIRYDKNDGLQGNSFKVNSSYKGSDGRLFFGGINGLNYFDPAEIKSNLIDAKPELTDLLINNQKPAYDQPDSANNNLNRIIAYSDELKLSHLQNNFVISFSSMHYPNPLKCKYRYKLIGYDRDWKYTDGKNPDASYSNLDYKNYRFIVEATNNDGAWSSAQASINILVMPPWWKSLPAKIIYTFLFIAVLLGIYFYQARWYRLKRELEIRAVNEKKREEMHHQREELYQQQLQFFTNISHEFRTPLTLIFGPLEKLIKENRNPVLVNSYQLMFRNVKRLINLINELMNFKKVADGAIKLQVQPLGIRQFCESIYQEFEDLALSKDIQFSILDRTVSGSTESLSNFFDAQVLEKILFNLLNNAFKYTNVGGQVRLEIFFDRNSFTPSYATEYHLKNENHRAKEYIYFLIADTGIGISKESISIIFDRYYRISKNHLGSGVGLALVKSLTQLHKGDISVYSDRHEGTEMLIGLPWGKENFTNDEITIPGSDTSLSQLELLDNSVLAPVNNNTHDNAHQAIKLSKHILLVDDNDELRAFLKQSLEKFYNIHEAGDGNTAITMSAAQIPDLIISDVMMPGMSGVELCRVVKNKFETSHIPFIILSAKDALETKIDGMKSGADYYFAKPLSIDLLLLTVHNIFEQSQRLKLKYTNDYLTEATELVHSEKDKDFINKLLELIEANIQEPDLDVDFLCNHLYISRTKLYQKIKSISDQSVGEFIKTIRLKKAIQIMTHEDIALNKVADRIGLQSHSYFSRMFKKEFGKSPSEFIQSLKKNVDAGGHN